MRIKKDITQAAPWTALFFSVLFSLILAGNLCSQSASSLKNRAKNHYYGINGVKKSYEKALELYLQAAELGDGQAQYISGGMYFKGMGTERNFNRAFQLLHAAAKKGRTSPESQQILGQGFLLGSGIPKNYDKAIYWYSQAAENGNAEAQNELGFMYFTGNGVELDKEKGASLFIKAAYNNLPIAQYNVGILYYTGNGVKEPDLIKSYGWLSLASTNGHRPASSAYNFLESVLTVKELREGQRYAAQLLEQVSNPGKLEKSPDK